MKADQRISQTESQNGDAFVLDPWQYACGFCGAEPTRWCRDTNGRDISGVHWARFNVIGDEHVPPAHEYEPTWCACCAALTPEQGGASEPEQECKA